MSFVFIFEVFRILKYWLHFTKDTNKRCLEYIERQNQSYKDDGDEAYKRKIIDFWQKFFEYDDIKVECDDIKVNRDAFLKEYQVSFELAWNKYDDFEESDIDFVDELLYSFRELESYEEEVLLPFYNDETKDFNEEKLWRELYDYI